MRSRCTTDRAAQERTILVVTAIACLLVACGPGFPGNASRLQWSRTVDSLIHDTTALAAPLDSLRLAAINASPDTVAIDAAMEFGSGSRHAAGDLLLVEARDLSRKLGYAHGEADAQYRLARVAVRQDRLAEADSLLNLTEQLVGTQTQGRWPHLRMKLRYTRADLQRYHRDPAGALAGFYEAMAMAQRLKDREWIVACEAALGGTYLSDLKFDSARVHCLRCVEMAKEVGDRDRMASCHNFLGEMYRIQQKYDKAIEHQNQALELAEQVNNRGRMAENLYALGEIYRNKDDFPRALEHYQRSLGHAQAMGMKQVAALDLLYMGDIHRGFEEYDMALEWYEKALDLARASGLNYLQAYCLIQAGRVQGEMKNPAGGLVDLQEALGLAETMKNDDLISKCRNSIGELLQMQGKYDEASIQYRTALELGRKVANADERFYAQQMGAIHQARGELVEAGEHGELAMREARRKNESPLEIAMAADLLYKVYRSLGRLDKAADMLETKMAMNDSVFNTRQLRKLSNLELKAQEEKMLAVQERQRAETVLALSAERRRRDLALLGGGSVMLVSLVLWAGYRRSRRQARALAQKNVELTTLQDQLVDSERQREAEQVRTRIARDVHDELGSDLTKLGLLGTEAKRRLSDHDATVTDVIDRIGKLSREVSGSLHDIVWAVDPERDSAQSMVDHARVYAERTLESTGISTDLRFAHEGPDRPIDPSTKRDIFRVMKEALNNALKYAATPHIALRLDTNSDGYSMRLRDEGTGFDKESVQRSGNGMRSMAARAKHLGAELRVESSPGHGSTVELRGRWPLEN